MLSQIDPALYWKLQSARNPRQTTHDICPVLASYGLELLVQSPEGEQSRLKPLIARTLGTLDRTAELRRSDYLVVKTVNRVLSLAVSQWPSIAQQCREATEPNAALRVASDAQRSLDLAYKSAEAAGDRSAVRGLLPAEGAASAVARGALALAADYTTKVDPSSDVWGLAFMHLDEAINLGRHDPVEGPFLTQTDKDEAASMEAAKKDMEARAMKSLRKRWFGFGR